MSLLSKYYKADGKEIYVSKIKDEKLADIEFTSIISLFLLGNVKKYELSFDFGTEINQKFTNDTKAKDNILDNYKIMISKILDVNLDNLIFTNFQEDSFKVMVLIINEKKQHKEKLKALKEKYSFIKKIEEKPLLDIIKISNNILDKKGDKKFWKKKKNNNKIIRGGLEYLKPFGWIGIGLKVKGKFDNGNNNWLDNKNESGEFAVASLDLKNNIIENILIQNENKNINLNNSFIKPNIFNKQQPQFSETTVGIFLFENPETVENYSEIINIFGLKLKIILMCRINPKKIRKSEKFPGCCILNPTTEEIRPYRILIKFMDSSLSE